MTARSFISSHRHCRRFLAATYHAAILSNYSHDLQVLHFTVERGESKKTPFRICTQKYNMLILDVKIPICCVSFSL